MENRPGIAGMELQHIKERQRAGIGAAKEKGIYQGRKKGSLKAKPERARELRDKGNSWQEIMAALNISRRTLSKYLKET